MVPYLSLHRYSLPRLAVIVLSAAAAGAIAAEKPREFTDGSAGAPIYRVYTYRQPDGVPVFSDKAPADQAFKVMAFSCYACNPKSKVNWNTVSLHSSKFNDIIDTAASAHGVDPALVRAVIHAESGFDPDALSKRGAIGLMQLMPDTAREMGVDPRSPTQNIHGGVAYLAQMIKRFGDIRLATAAYNAGPGAVSRFNDAPPYPETRTYVERVSVLHQRYRARPGVAPG